MRPKGASLIDIAPDEDGTDFRQRSSNFVEWFRKQPGCRLNPKVQIADLRHEGSGRGVLALLDLETDEELFAIPRNLVLTTSTSSIPQEVLEPLRESGSWPPLIVSIVYEYLRGKESQWYSYFQVLPTRFDTLMFWTDDELGYLQASAVVKKIGKAGAEVSWRTSIIPLMLEYYDLFPVPGDDLEQKTNELIRLAHFAGSLIMAYAFDIDRDDEEQPNGEVASNEEFEEDDEDEPLKGMVPYADMLNADADRNNARLFQEDQYLIMKATKPIRPAEEIYNDYGPLPRSDLLRMYGYVTENYAQYDVVEISHDLLVEVAGMRDPTKNDAWLKREEQLDEIGIIDDGYSIPRPPKDAKLEDYLPGNIHMLLRGLCLDASNPRIPKLHAQESISIEEAALLSAVATKKLSEYHTTLSQDKMWYHNQYTLKTKRMELAMQVRIGEKEILHDLIDLCQSHIAEKTNEIAANGKKRKIENGNETTTSKKASRRR